MLGFVMRNARDSRDPMFLNAVYSSLVRSILEFDSVI